MPIARASRRPGKDEQQLAGLDGLDSNERRVRLHEEEKAEAAWSRPQASTPLTASPTAAAGAALGVVSIIPRPSPAFA